MGYTREQLDQARAFDSKLARERGSYQPFKGGRLTRRLSLPAFYNMYRDCPPGTPPEERARYLADNERLYLDINAQKTTRTRNRWGRVTERTIYLPDGSKQTIQV